MKYFKSLLTAVVLAGLSSCLSHSPLSHVTYYTDYQEASQGKLFISEANSVNFEYEPLGSILVEEIPGSVKITVPTTEKERQRDNDGLYGAVPATKTITSYSQATAQTALNYAASQAITMGGDGLINLKLTSYIKDEKRIVQVTGMVIKRK